MAMFSQLMKRTITVGTILIKEYENKEIHYLVDGLIDRI
jgi:hypothetical protein